MPQLKPGDLLAGRYAIDTLIGVGGLGEVYRGRDLKLHQRAVAIKVLQRSLTDRDVRKNSVEAEVRSLSGLNHPHIAVLYDVCDHDGLEVMVMELVDGETLATILSRGRLTEAKALQYGAQIIDALAYAHRKGLVHRDVKPSNIIVTSQGAKLLDFGLASLVRPAPAGIVAGSAGDDASSLAGTPFYMSPEQAAGLALDHRTDIYAFGLVLCQMLTGFTPDSVSGISTRTLINGLLDQIGSRPLRLVLERCLVSNPDDRWLHADDLHHALIAVSEAAPRRLSNAPSSPPRFSTLARVAIAGAVLTLGTVVAVGWMENRRDAALAEYQFAISAPQGMHFVSLETGGPAAISPDGQTVAFVAADETGMTSIWTRPLNVVVATPVQGTQGASHPFWSPDSQFIAFFAAGRLQRIAASGGTPRVIVPAAQGRGGSWSSGNVILFAPGFTESLYRVPADGGDVEPVTALDFSNRETSHRWPVFLPDGRRFLFFVRSDRPDVRGLYLGTLDSPRRTRLGNITSSAVYAASPQDDGSYLVFSHEGFLKAQRFSLSEGRLLGEMLAILQLPMPDEDTSVAPVSVSTTGVLVHGGGSVFRQPLLWIDRNGQELGSISALGQYRNLRLSPDGQRVALERLELRTGLASVWLFDLGRNVQQRFDFAPGASFSPVWSPDGKSVLFASYRGAEWDLVQRGAMNESDLRVLRTAAAQAATDWSRDGKWIIYQERGPRARDQWDIGALEVPSGNTRSLIRSDHNEHQGQLSPDSSWLAYTSNESGRDEVYLQRFPSMVTRLRVSAAGGSQPKWRTDAGELFYLGASRELMSVGVDLRSEPPTLSESRVLARPRMAPAAGFLSISSYEIDRTTGRFLVAAPAEAQNIHQQLTVVVNWLTETSPQ